MAQPPKYAPCEIVLDVFDGSYLFRLPLKQIAELQEKCNAGIGTIFRRVLTGEEYIQDLVETIRLGLIGGGCDPVKAANLIDRYTTPPLTIPEKFLWNHAVLILSACCKGYEPPKKKAPRRKARKDGSTSAEHTQTADSLADTPPAS